MSEEKQEPSITFAPLNSLIDNEVSTFATETTNLVARAITELQADLENLIHVIEKANSLDERGKP